jgi:hypothetical protein
MQDGIVAKKKEKGNSYFFSTQDELNFLVFFVFCLCLLVYLSYMIPNQGLKDYTKPT